MQISSSDTEGEKTDWTLTCCSNDEAHQTYYIFRQSKTKITLIATVTFTSEAFKSKCKAKSGSHIDDLVCKL